MNYMENFKQNLNNKIEREGLHHFESNEKKEFPFWKTVLIGAGEKTGKEMTDTLTREGFYVSGSSDSGAKDIINKVEFASSPEELELVKVTPSDLGFKEMPSLRAMNARAEDLGLNLCPAEIGPRLRLAYKDQPKNDCIDIGMVPIMDSEGHAIIFSVIEEEGILYLHSNYNSEVQVYDINTSFVYVKGDKKFYDLQSSTDRKSTRLNSSH